MTSPYSPVPIFVRMPLVSAAAHQAVAQAGGLDPLLDRLTNGEPVAAIAKSLGVSRAELARWVRSLPPPEAAEWAAAEKAGASAMMEATIEIADTTAENVAWHEDAKPADLIKASAQRISARQFYSERVDKDKWGARPTTEINMSFSSIFIDALRRRTRPEPAALPAHEPAREETLADYL